MLRDKEVLLKEANHVMTVCNACRYCEGFCAVFPAMELRRMFTVGDMKYFANLCHNCRGCYYACQYAPPHEFDLNIPKTFAELRLELYKEYAWPGFMKGLLKNGPWTTTFMTLGSILLVFLLAWMGNGEAGLFTAREGDFLFYQTVPYRWMMAPFMLVAALVVLGWAKGVCNFWKSIEAPMSDMFDLRAHLVAIKDVLTLHYLGGGGHGCNYPDESFSMSRRNFHHFVFYGFLLCLASTCLAFFLEHALDIPHPFGPLSPVVLLGFFGGVSICFGCGGLWWLKGKMDTAPASALVTPGDRAFIVLVFCVAFTGLMLLFLRSTPAMGMLLVIHLGVVLSFFLLAPYGKLLHAVYRYFALVRNAQEQYRADEAEAAKK